MMAQQQRALIRMPELVGLPLRKAQLLIENAGLRVDAVLFAESYEERNTVLAQKPLRGQMVYVGEKVTITVSRESYAKWLPSIYQRSDVTGRNFVRDLLWITQHLFGSIEDVLDIIHTYFDPLESPEEFLPWLAGWTAMILEEDWPVAKKRKLLKEAIPLYKLRGTVKGLKLFIALFTGHEPEIIENQWPFGGFRVGITSLVGIDTIILPQVNLATTFIVEMPHVYKDVSVEGVIRLHEIIQMEKPANTSYCLRFLAEERAAEMRGFFVIGERSGIAVGHEVVKALPEGAVLFDEEERVVEMRPSDQPQTETVDEFVPPTRGKPPLPKAPKADDAPIEGREVRTSKAGGFDDAAKEIDLSEIRRLMEQEGLSTGDTRVTGTTLPASDTTVSPPPTEASDGGDDGDGGSAGGNGGKAKRKKK